MHDMGNINVAVSLWVLQRIMEMSVNFTVPGEWSPCDECCYDDYLVCRSVRLMSAVQWQATLMSLRPSSLPMMLAYLSTYSSSLSLTVLGRELKKPCPGCWQHLHDTTQRYTSVLRHVTCDGHGPRFSVANFAKFRGTVCEILQNSTALLSPNAIHSASDRHCCINLTTLQSIRNLL